ncbi:hypothetical protein SAICODRAFT_100533 [Saitoella complicata NRRL Y-17804]|nr:uncharacterized protein SAICODRAFT_100533 [Saitoella complicata NRRL Y-17804]ODQ56057.1 hypothetical protein SAICODRAFT_100533 [Saitoella complicata NRRL Y-17804]
MDFTADIIVTNSTADNPLQLHESQLRQSLFYDECAKVYLVLKYSFTVSDDAVLDHLAKSNLVLEAALVAPVQNPTSSQTQTAHQQARQQMEGHMIFSETHIGLKKKPDMTGTVGDFRCMFFSFGVRLNYVRLRSPASPRLALTSYLDFNQSKNAQAVKARVLDDYMEPLTVPTPNLLSSIYTASSVPYLPTSRITSTSADGKPTSRSATSIANRRLCRKMWPVSSAMQLKMQSTHLNSRGCLMMSIDLEASVETAITSVDVHIHGGKAVPLGDNAGDKGVKELLPRDQVTLLYTLIADTPAGPSIKPVKITLKLKPSVREGGLDSGPECTSLWNSTVNFDILPQRTGSAGAPNTPRLQRPLSMVPSRTLSHARTNTQMTVPTSSLQSPGGITGLTLTFSAPDRVKVGQTFTLDIFLVNGNLHRGRRLALSVIPAQRKALPPLPVPASTKDPILSDESLFALHRARIELEAEQLVPLSGDVRVGPLGASTCHEVKMQFVGTTEGVFPMCDGIRVVDLVNGGQAECRNVPRIVVCS